TRVVADFPGTCRYHGQHRPAPGPLRPRGAPADHGSGEAARLSGRQGRGMLVIVGMLIVTGSVMGGYLLEGGPMAVLIQPIEGLIIIGAALGTLVISTPLPQIKGLVAAILALLKGSGPSRAAFMEALALQYEIFVNARKHGFIALERDIAEPE